MTAHVSVSSRGPSRSAARPRWPLVIAGVFLCAAIAIFPAYAQEAQPQPAQTFGIRPVLTGTTTLSGGHFVYAVPAGSELNDAVQVANLSSGPLTIDVYAANLLMTPDGGPSPGQQGQPGTGATPWLTVSRATLSLAPHAQADDAFSVAVPIGTPPGDYFATVVAAQAGGPREANGLVTSSRLALIVQITVPGVAHPHVRVGGLKVHRAGNYDELSVVVSNDGNTLAELSGGVDIKTTFGKAHVELGPANAYVIPGGRATMNATWSGLPIAGRARFGATVKAQTHDQPVMTLRTAPATQWFIPLWPVAVIGALGILAFVTRKRRRARRERRADERRVLAEYREGRTR